MNSSLMEFVFDIIQCSSLSLERKQPLLNEMSKRSDDDPEKVLQSLSKKELLEILCGETKERKFTGLPKPKLIEHIMKIALGKKSAKRKDEVDLNLVASPPNIPSTSKRQRKSDNPTRFPIAACSSIKSSNDDLLKYCPNLACRATLNPEDAFCRRCTCCICRQYDDNKDPSLWLLCSSDYPYTGDSCGRSCHLACAMKHKRAGISKDEHGNRLDAIFCCVYCGKINDMLGCWNKQLTIVKDTRRVDILCYRLSLSLKLLNGTNKYAKFCEIVDHAAKMLEGDVGPLDDTTINVGRSIVNRLSSGPEVQKLCASVVEPLDKILTAWKKAMQDAHLPIFKSQGNISSVSNKCSSPVVDSRNATPGLMRVETISATSVTVVLNIKEASLQKVVGCNFWHRKSDIMEFPAEPTYTLSTPDTRFSLSGLSPETEYWLRAVPFNDALQLGLSEVNFKTIKAFNAAAKSLGAERDPSPTTNSSSLSNPSSEGDESNNIAMYGDRDDNVPEQGLKKMPGDSVSALEDEQVNGEDGSVHNSTNQIEVPRNPTNPVIEKHVPEISRPENLSHDQFIKEMETDKGSNSSRREETVMVPFERGSNGTPPISPFKPEIVKDVQGSANPEASRGKLQNEPDKPEMETQAGSSSKKTIGPRSEECTTDGSLKAYEFCVKTIRQLECEGYIEKNFRVKFLTWYSLRADESQKRVVEVYVKTFVNDPVGLAGQLIDSFSELMSKNSNRPPGIPPYGFCRSLYHH